MEDMVRALSSLPATDGNFMSCLCRAKNEEISKAIDVMKASNGMHKSRISACERELRKRKKKNET